MSENLIKREDLRQSAIESKKKDKESNKIDCETSDYVMKHINDLKAVIEMKLDLLDKIEAKDELDDSLKEVNCDYETLNQYVSDSVLYLAKYNIKLSQNILNCIRNQIDVKKDSLVPKSKFSFKSTFKRNVKNPEKDVSVKPQLDSVDATDSSTFHVEFIGFKDMKDCDQTLIMTAEECNLKDIQLERLTNCRIEIYGSPNALKINGLTNCSVYCGPITTSALIANCHNSVLRMASQQLRIHCSSDCDIYLHVTSRAIIEESTKIRFAPYDWTYDSIGQHFKSANLDINCINWKQIDDFDCLTTDKPSNNWSFIEPIGH